MNPFPLLLTLLMTSTLLSAQVNIRFEIESLPEYHPSGSDVYLAGSFNGWNPSDTSFRFERDDKGHYTLKKQLAAGTYEYKVTRGAWELAESRKGGGTLANRVLKVQEEADVKIKVEEWADRFPAAPKKSTASKNVTILDTAFLIPQLKRTRRVWIYLPEDYSVNTKKHWPVLYLHDGQNVFDDATSYSGEWGVDEFMDSKGSKSCIVVAIDHGGAKRLNEYNPFDNEKFGKGEGDAYVEFLVKTLKPYIDKNFRTQKTAKSTFIGGSSMGGLISFYAVLRFPKVFGAACIFSPAFWVAGPQLDEVIRKRGAKVQTQMYFYGGGKEGEQMVPDMEKVTAEMKKLTNADIRVVIKPDGQHNEGNWKREFPVFYNWVLNK